MNVGEWLSQAEGRLAAAGIESSRLEAQVLAAHALLVDRSWLFTHHVAEFPDLAGESLLQRRERREPLAYIIGKREFYGREFRVGPGVLIPRQDTETLVETALAAIDPTAKLDILDVGVGSGAIAITLKLERPFATVTGLDISEQALAIALANAEELDARVRFLASDGFEQVKGERFDLVVSNPPYIADFESLPSEVAEFEPSVALISGPTGLEFYRRLAVESVDHLQPGGSLMIEVGHTQAASVRRLFETSGWRWVQTVKDLGGIERVVVFDLADK